MGINVMLRRHKSTIVGLDVALAGLQENINLENQARVAAIGEKIPAGNHCQDQPGRRNQ